MLLGTVVLACLYATPIAWLYWGWKQEQPAREMVQRVGRRISALEAAGPALLDKIVPARLVWIRERCTIISLWKTSATDDDLRTLRQLGRLQQLDLFLTQVTDAGLVHLKGHTGLRVLYLPSTRVTDAGLVHLSALTKLQELWLNETEVTDAGLAHLRLLTGLQELGLNETGVTDAGLVHLKGLAGLRVLALIGTKVTDAGVDDLEKALPQCSIWRWYAMISAPSVPIQSSSCTPPALGAWASGELFAFPVDEVGPQEPWVQFAMRG